METVYHTASDGYHIAHYHWPLPAPRHILVIAHGMAEHAARYDGLATFLNSQGIAVHALDHRGHGLSAKGQPLGHFGDENGWDKVIGDLAELIDQLRHAQPSIPLTLFGHSMGSFVSRSLFLRHHDKLNGLMLCATGFRQAPIARQLGKIAQWLGRRNGIERPSRTMSRLVFGTFNLRFFPARTAADWLSRDPAEVDKYIADPLCGFDCTPGLWRDLFAAIVEMEGLEDKGVGFPLNLPIWLFAGSHDPVSMGGKGCQQLAERYRQAGMRNVEVSIFPLGRHEMLNEANKLEAWEAMAGRLLRGFT